MTDRFETLAVHAGAEPDPHTGAVVPAIQMSTTFKQDGVGGLRSGFEYGRAATLREALEDAIADSSNGRTAWRRPGLAATQPAATARDRYRLPIMTRVRRHVASATSLPDTNEPIDRPPLPRCRRIRLRRRAAAAHGFDRDALEPALSDRLTRPPPGVLARSLVRQHVRPPYGRPAGARAPTVLTGPEYLGATRRRCG